MEPFTLILAALLAQTSADSMPPAPPPPPARAMMRADANSDGIVTRDEAQAQADAQFAAMDTDHNGKLTGEERRAGMAAMRAARTGGDTPRPPRGDDPRDGGPRDGGPRGGGYMGGGDMTQAAFRDRAAQRFDRLDADHDGTVSRAEMTAARSAMRGGDRPQPPADD
jgi:hypothetical protein